MITTRMPVHSVYVTDRVFWEPAHFVMERRLMQTIERLAERDGADA
jgi:hypothetical protein